MKKQIFKAVIAGIISPVILTMLLVMIPLYVVAFIVHLLDDDFDKAAERFINHTEEYINEWKYTIDLYIRIFTFKKNK
jgi:hypothetical protein